MVGKVEIIKSAGPGFDFSFPESPLSPPEAEGKLKHYPATVTNPGAISVPNLGLHFPGRKANSKRTK